MTNQLGSSRFEFEQPATDHRSDVCSQGSSSGLNFLYGSVNTLPSYMQSRAGLDVGAVSIEVRQHKRRRKAVILDHYLRNSIQLVLEILLRVAFSTISRTSSRAKKGHINNRSTR